MGRAGRRLLTPTQRKLAATLSPRSASAGIRAAAATATRNADIVGPVVSAGTSPVWAPATLDATLGGALPVADAAALGSAGPGSTALGSTGPGWTAGGLGRTEILLDGMPLGRERMPALAGALDVAAAAFGSSVSSAPAGRRVRRMPGVFSPGRMDRALGGAPSGAGAGSPVGSGGREPVPGYQALLYDAAETTWVVPQDDGGAARALDAADAAAAVRRTGAPVRRDRAALQLIAQAVERSIQSTGAAQHIAQMARTGKSPVASGRSASAPHRAGVPAPAAAMGLPVVAPVAELRGLSQERIARELTARIRPSGRIGVAAEVPGVAGTSAVTVVDRRPSASAAHRGGVSTQLAGLVPGAAQGETRFRWAEAHGGDDAASARGPVAVFQPRAAAFATQIPSAKTWSPGPSGAAGGRPDGGADRQAAGGTSGHLSGLDVRLMDGTLLDAGGELAHAVGTIGARAGAPGAMGSQFTARLASGSVGITSTRPEIFAARHMRDAERAGGTAALVRPADGPVTVAGEVRYGYADVASPWDDPVVYVSLPEMEPTASGASALRGTSMSARRTPAMGRGVESGLRAITMPLSSAAGLQAQLASGRGTPGVPTSTAATTGSRGGGITLAGELLGSAPLGVPPQPAGRFDASLPTAAVAQPGGAGFDASRIVGLGASEATPGGPLRLAVGSDGGILTSRSGDQVASVPSLGTGALRFSAALGGAAAASVDSTPAAIGAAGRAASAVGASAIAARGAGAEPGQAPAFYGFSYDAETVTLAGGTEASAAYRQQIAGGHVELRGGRLVRAVPANRAAERAARVRPLSAAGASAATAPVPGAADLAAGTTWADIGRAVRSHQGPTAGTPGLGSALAAAIAAGTASSSAEGARSCWTMGMTSMPSARRSTLH